MSGLLGPGDPPVLQTSVPLAATDCWPGCSALLGLELSPQLLLHNPG